MLKGLHHIACRCRDSEETRKFYEDFLGYRMDDGSCIAFFEAPDMPFEFKPQHDYDLHIALEVSQPDLEAMFAKGRAAGIETRGISDHRFINSIYFRDPNGYVVELTAKAPGHDEAMDGRKAAAQTIAAWQSRKSHVAA